MEQCPNRQYHCKFEVVGCDFQVGMMSHCSTVEDLLRRISIW